MTVPTNLVLHTASRRLEVAFDDGRVFSLPFELLRVLSPSAEVRGHGPGQEVLQTGKRDVTVEAFEPVGHYGLKLRFSDGHDTGIYSWSYLLDLGEHQHDLWLDYLQKLDAAGSCRNAPPVDRGQRAVGCSNHRGSPA